MVLIYYVHLISPAITTKCYSCQSKIKSECENEVTREVTCREGETRCAKIATRKPGEVRYGKGCVRKLQCDQMGGKQCRDIGNIITLCADCCEGDLCNVGEVPGTNLLASTRPPVAIVLTFRAKWTGVRSSIFDRGNILPGVGWSLVWCLTFAVVVLTPAFAHAALTKKSTLSELLATPKDEWGERWYPFILSL